MSTIGSPALTSSIGVLPSTEFTVNDSVSYLDSQQQTMATLEQQVSSGMKFAKPSDDPAGVVQAMQLQSALTRSQTYTSNISSATSVVSQANSILTETGTSLQSLRTLVLQASNSTNQSASALASIASQVTSIGQSIAANAGSTVAGQPVFGTNQQTATVAQGTTVPVSVTASTAFGSGTSSLQSVINQITTDMSNGSFATGSTASNDLAALDSAITGVTNAAAAVGSQYTALQNYATQATTQTTSLTSQLSSVQNVDTAQAAVSLEQAQTDYQTSEWAATQVLSQSLVEFLK